MLKVEALVLCNTVNFLVFLQMGIGDIQPFETNLALPLPRLRPLNSFAITAETIYLKAFPSKDNRNVAVQCALDHEPMYSPNSCQKFYLFPLLILFQTGCFLH